MRPRRLLAALAAGVLASACGRDGASVSARPPEASGAASRDLVYERTVRGNQDLYEVRLPNTLTLQGEAHGAGPRGDVNLTSIWTEVSGPAPVAFTDPTSPVTTVLSNWNLSCKDIHDFFVRILRGDLKGQALPYESHNTALRGRRPSNP